MQSKPRPKTWNSELHFLAATPQEKQSNQEAQTNQENTRTTKHIQETTIKTKRTRNTREQHYQQTIKNLGTTQITGLGATPFIK